MDVVVEVEEGVVSDLWSEVRGHIICPLALTDELLCRSLRESHALPRAGGRHVLHHLLLLCQGKPPAGLQQVAVKLHASQ